MSCGGPDPNQEQDTNLSHPAIHSGRHRETDQDPEASPATTTGTTSTDHAKRQASALVRRIAP